MGPHSFLVLSVKVPTPEASRPPCSSRSELVTEVWLMRASNYPGLQDESKEGMFPRWCRGSVLDVHGMLRQGTEHP